jgi:hypothetical protein
MRQIFDLEVVQSIVNHPDIKYWMTVDGSMEYRPKDIYLALYDTDNLRYLGLAIVRYYTNTIVEVHLGIVRKAMTANAGLSFAQEVKRYINDKLNINEAIITIRDSNKACLWFARRFGFKLAFTLKDAVNIEPDLQGVYDDLHILTYRVAVADQPSAQS